MSEIIKIFEGTMGGDDLTYNFLVGKDGEAHRFTGKDISVPGLVKILRTWQTYSSPIPEGEEYKMFSSLYEMEGITYEVLIEEGVKHLFLTDPRNIPNIWWLGENNDN